VALVGGGAPLVAQLFTELGRDVVTPDYASVANSNGAAIAQVGGEVDLTFSLSSITRAAALARAEREAHRRAAEAGARPGSIRTVELKDEIPFVPLSGR
jgi:hypothetical protein